MPDNDPTPQRDQQPPMPAPLPTPENAPAPYHPYGQVQPYPNVGKIRDTGVSMLLFFVTFGIYGFVWFFLVHEEMKRHKGDGIGGGIALLLYFFVGIVMPYITSYEVGDLYQRRRQAAPVSAATGLWYFPGIFILVGPFIWFVRTNGALNAYWRSLGAR